MPTFLAWLRHESHLPWSRLSILTLPLSLIRAGRLLALWELNLNHCEKGNNGRDVYDQRPDVSELRLKIANSLHVVARSNENIKGLDLNLDRGRDLALVLEQRWSAPSGQEAWNMK